jgi:hypothetical protein
LARLLASALAPTATYSFLFFLIFFLFLHTDSTRNPKCSSQLQYARTHACTHARTQSHTHAYTLVNVYDVWNVCVCRLYSSVLLIERMAQ